MVTFVLTHGLGDSAATWRDLVPALTAGHRVQTWELPGHGARAGEVPHDQDLRHVAHDLAAVAAEAAPPVVLVGHSAGGYAALRSVAVEKAPVAGLVLLGTGPGFRRPADLAAWNDAMDRFAARAGLSPALGRLVHLYDAAVIEALPRTPTPTLVITGSDDLPSYRAGTDHLVKHLPHAELHVIPGAGHDPQHTHHAQTANAILAFAARLAD